VTVQHSDSILIREVGLRDGLQAEQRFIPTEQKVELARSLAAAGLQEIEVTSFVSPRAVPQFQDAKEVIKILGHPGNVSYSALVVNLRGAEDAIAAGVKELQFVVSASETHSQKNVRMSISEALVHGAKIAALAKQNGVKIRTALATSFGCPYEGFVPYDTVYTLMEKLFAMGIDRISLGDTAGLGNPKQVSELCRGILSRFPDAPCSLHLHDTRGVGLACVLAGVWSGIRVIESSVGGIGGCPFIPNATGNIATEDVVYMLESMGLATNLDQEKLLASAVFAEKILGRSLNSKQLALLKSRHCNN